MGAIPDLMDENIHLVVGSGSAYYEVLGAVHFALAVRRGLEAGNTFLCEALFATIDVYEDASRDEAFILYSVHRLVEIALAHGVVLRISA